MSRGDILSKKEGWSARSDDRKFKFEGQRCLVQNYIIDLDHKGLSVRLRVLPPNHQALRWLILCLTKYNVKWHRRRKNLGPGADRLRKLCWHIQTRVAVDNVHIFPVVGSVGVTANFDAVFWLRLAMRRRLSRRGFTFASVWFTPMAQTMTELAKRIWYWLTGMTLIRLCWHACNCVFHLYILTICLGTRERMADWIIEAASGEDRIAGIGESRDWPVCRSAPLPLPVSGTLLSAPLLSWLFLPQLTAMRIPSMHTRRICMEYLLDCILPIKKHLEDDWSCNVESQTNK